MTRVSVFVIDLRIDPASLPGCSALLDGEEQARAARFLRAADRWRFIASHAALRLLLGRALGRAPTDLVFAQEPAGRPFLVGVGERSLDFNLSHSGDHAVLGMAWGARIGVDVETRRPLPDALRIARAHFAADEVADLAALPPPAVEAAFFGLWTRKEAVVKALGAGLSLPLSAFSVAVPPSAPRMLRPIAGTGAWTLAAIPGPPGMDITAAVTAEELAVGLEHLAPDWAEILATK